jgi:hypothetical protein
MSLEPGEKYSKLGAVYVTATKLKDSGTGAPPCTSTGQAVSSCRSERGRQWPNGASIFRKGLWTF